MVCSVTILADTIDTYLANHTYEGRPKNVWVKRVSKIFIRLMLTHREKANAQ
jgi:hypothetical protein